MMIHSNLPEVTSIYKSKLKPTFALICFFVLTCFGLYSLIQLFFVDKNEIYQWAFTGLFFTIYGGIYTKLKYQERIDIDYNALITISTKGIETITTRFQKWEDIKNEKIIHLGSGNHILVFFTYDFPGGNEKLKINDITIQFEKLEALLKAYRRENMLMNNPRERKVSTTDRDSIIRNFFGEESTS